MASSTPSTLDGRQRRGHSDERRDPATGRRARRRLSLAAVAILALGVWGVTAPAGPAAPGDAVPVPGGSMTVDRVGDVDLSMPMSGPGMSMPMGKGVPSIPEGSRRVEVDVTLRADPTDPLWFRADALTVAGPDVPPTPGIFTEDAGTFVPPGGALTRTVAFEVPEETQELELSLDDAARSITLHLGDAPTGGHAH